MYENCDSHHDNKVKQGLQCTNSVFVHTSDEVRLGAALPRVLSVTAKSFVLSLIPTSPHSQHFSGARANHEVGDDACLIARFASQCMTKDGHLRRRRGWGLGLRVSSALLGDILASSLVCKHAHDSSAQAKTFPRCNDKP